MRPRHRVRLAVNLLNGSTLAGLAVSLAGHARLARFPGGLLVGTGYRLPVPPAPAFTLGNVILTRHEPCWPRHRPAPARGQARHAVRLVRRPAHAAALPRRGGGVLAAFRRLRRLERLRARRGPRRRRLCRPAAPGPRAQRWPREQRRQKRGPASMRSTWPRSRSWTSRTCLIDRQPLPVRRNSPG